MVHGRIGLTDHLDANPTCTPVIAELTPEAVLVRVIRVCRAIEDIRVRLNVIPCSVGDVVRIAFGS